MAGMRFVHGGVVTADFVKLLMDMNDLWRRSGLGGVSAAAECPDLCAGGMAPTWQVVWVDEMGPRVEPEDDGGWGGSGVKLTGQGNEGVVGGPLPPAAPGLAGVAPPVLLISDHATGVN